MIKDKYNKYLRASRKGGIIELKGDRGFAVYSQPLKDTIVVEDLITEDNRDSLLSMVEYLGRCRGCKYILTILSHAVQNKSEEELIMLKYGFEKYRVDLLCSYYRKEIN